MTKYQICKRCIMDTTDSEIVFDKNGLCNHCKTAEKIGDKIWKPNEEGQNILQNIINKVREDGKNKKYDAIIGLSGGVDSSYLAYIAAKYWNLRLLAVHVDGGWNIKMAENNVRSICEEYKIDLEVIKIDWEAMRKLQIAFLRAAVPNQDIPQDHAFFATLYSFAVKNNIKYVLNGSNWATECILPKSWGYNAMDAKHIIDIYNKHGEGRLENFPLIDFYKVKIYYPYIKGMKILKLLNLIPYSKESAINELEENTGWRYYGGKHYESIWTRFMQSYYLPNKFNIDKRRAHLSSLIMSKEITREMALEQMKEPLYNQEDILALKEIISDKLQISVKEFNELIEKPTNKHENYYCTSKELKYKLLMKINDLRK